MRRRQSLPWIPAFAGARSGADERGFTLLEMMVALAVFSIAALALIKLQAVTLRTAADMDGRIMGQIVARNLMVEIETDPTAPGVGREEGDVENGGRQWHWARETTKTGDARVVRIDLVVNGAGVRSPAALTFLKASE